MRPDTVVNERRNTSAEISCCNVKAPRTRLLLGLLAIGMIAGGPAVPLGNKALQVVNNSAFDGTAARHLGAGPCWRSAWGATTAQSSSKIDSSESEKSNNVVTFAIRYAAPVATILKV
jgi:hypothetical protein